MTETAVPNPAAPRTLMAVIGSVRPGRQGDKWGRWIADVARRHSGYAVEVVDLAELALPFLDEPHHPRLHRYEHEHTKQWSAKAAAADAFVFVTPEYNYSFPASLKNALDYLYVEWKDKVAGVVSYGGLSGGLRATHQLRQVLEALGLAVPPGTVAIPFSAQYLTEEGGVDAPDSAVLSAQTMLAEMERVGALLRPHAS
ncbi:NAD(P)H-dependent oxidoreductase [Brachybacterium huguangmaarense]|uniref:NAD(P)H-dependent oxidoreductase n=1 Tax=Brachybacterium huguangmaarense TaxID=1652028 RepID=A0ABY6G3H9_9MICO|nr:NAD(P)H-dependent oxidoreductase [Brachybacterium huguangmaarense]UYG17672.1 NAD(P)H-dependent oxidoreductase [Brachybacterium huguangmaarense]